MPERYTDKELFEEFGALGSPGRSDLLKFIQRKTRGNEIAAREVESALWGRVAASKPVFPHRTPAKTWLYKVVENLAIDYHRARTRDFLARCDTRAGHSEEGTSIGFDFATDYIDNSPESALLREEEAHQNLAKLVIFLGELDEVSMSIVLKRLGGNSLEEIAESLKMPLSSVKARFYRALERGGANGKKIPPKPAKGSDSGYCEN